MIIDLVVVAILLISAAISFLRGLIRETLTIAGMIGGLFAAYSFGDNLSPIFRKWLDVDPDAEIQKKLFDVIPYSIIADGLAYISIFIIVVIVISVISHFIGATVKALGLGPIDRTLGVFFGLARGILLLGLIYLPFHLLMDAQNKTQYFDDSKTFSYIERTSEYLSGFLPESQDIEDKIDDIEKDTIKKKLFDNNILSNDERSKDSEPKKENTQTGYDQDKRENLENLIEDKATLPDDTLENRPLY